MHPQQIKLQLEKQAGLMGMAGKAFGGPMGAVASLAMGMFKGPQSIAQRAVALRQQAQSGMQAIAR